MRIEEVYDENIIEDLISIAMTHTDGASAIARVEAALRKELAECGGNRRFFLAYDDDAPEAFVELVFNHADNDPELANGEDVAHAHNLQVKKDRQGRGIGTAMMRHIEQAAAAMGKRKLTLGVDFVNTRARRLYDRLAYVHMKDVSGPTPEQDGVYLYKMI